MKVVLKKMSPCAADGETCVILWAFDKIPGCDRQTDKQTDGTACNKVALWQRWREKNHFIKLLWFSNIAR